MTKATPSTQSSALGFTYGLLAYTWWGIVVTLFYRSLREIHAIELVAHRIIWGVPFLFILLTVTRQWPTIVTALRTPRTLAYMSLTAALICVNWCCFVYAVVSDRLLESSLGYYMNPILSVVLGMVVLKERLRPLQIVGLVIAVLAVAAFTISHGSLPWIALAVASSFGFYGLLRKQAPVGAIPGLTIEMGLLMIPALVLAAVAWNNGTSAFSVERVPWWLVLGSGIVTVLPLVWFTAAARRLRLSTIGFMQYIAPTLQALLAVKAFGEPMTTGTKWTFVAIWIAIAFYTVDSLRHARRV